MSTRSYIVFDNNKKLMPYRYHHFDGYISGLGEVLQEKFTSKADVEFLFSKNCNMSAIQVTEDEHNEMIEKATSSGDKNHYIFSDLKRFKYVSFKGLMMKFYDSAKGDGESEAEIKKQKTNMADIYKKCTQSYIYLFQDNQWLVSIRQSTFMPLKECIFFNKLVEFITNIDKKDMKKYGLSKNNAKLSKTEREEESEKITNMYMDSLRTSKKLLEFTKSYPENAIEIYQSLKLLPEKQKNALIAAYGAANNHENYNLNLDVTEAFTSFIERNLINESVVKTMKKNERLKL